MEKYVIEPAHTPFPTPTNLPFQSDAGIHTSKRMSESAVGRIVPVSRQNAGSRSYAPGGTGGPPGAGPGGGLNAPGATLCARVISVCASFRLASCSQSAAFTPLA